MRCVSVPLIDAQQGTLVSVAFNFQHGTAARKRLTNIAVTLNLGDSDGALRRMGLYVKQRRKRLLLISKPMRVLIRPSTVPRPKTRTETSRSTLATDTGMGRCRISHRPVPATTRGTVGRRPASSARRRFRDQAARLSSGQVFRPSSV